MRDHAVEAARGFQPVRHRLAFKVDADVDAGGSRGLDDGELLVPAQTHVGLLGGDLDVLAELCHRLDERIVDGTQSFLLA